MKNLYGFKREDAINLLAYLKENKGKSLTSIFSEYATACSKSKGTIRNLYYALTKLSQKDEEFCGLYLEGCPLEAKERVGFTPCQERALLKQILLKKGQGVSVRRAVRELSCGDEKLALRYQNKYRSLLISKKELVLEIINEIKEQNEGYSFTPYKPKSVKLVN